MELSVFKVNQLGDNVLFLPVVETLQRVLPDAVIHLHTGRIASPLYEGLLQNGTLTDYDTARFLNSWKRPWELGHYVLRGRRRVGKTSLLAFDQGTTAFVMAAMNGARSRFTWDRTRCKGRWLADRTVSVRNPKAPVEIDWEIARGMLTALDAGDLWPEKPPVPRLEHLRCLNGVEREASRVVIHAGASLPYKSWPIDRYVDLANRYAESAEVYWVDQRKGEETFLSDHVTVVHKPCLREFIALVKSAGLFVGNNSGPMHIASAVGTPGVVLTGPSQPWWDPYYHAERFRVLRRRDLPCQPCDGRWDQAGVCASVRKFECLKAWSVDQVLSECLQWSSQWNPKKLSREPSSTTSPGKTRAASATAELPR